jgi:hypothetical protein
MANELAIIDLNQTSVNLVKAMGDGVLATQLVQTLVHACVASGDTVFISNAIRSLKEKGDKAGDAAVRKVFGAIFTGSTGKMSKDKKVLVLSIKRDASNNVQFDKEALARLDLAVADGLNIRDALAKRVKGDTDKPALSTEKMHKNTVAAVKKRVENKQCSLLEAVIAERAALKELEAMLVASTSPKLVAA